MKETKVTVQVAEASLDTLQDCMDFLVWAQGQDGLSVAVVCTVDGDIVVQAEGFAVPTVYASIGDVVRWDGTVFSVEKKVSA